MIITLWHFLRVGAIVFLCPTIIWRVLLHEDDRFFVDYRFGWLIIQVVRRASLLFSLPHFRRIFFHRLCCDTRTTLPRPFSFCCSSFGCSTRERPLYCVVLDAYATTIILVMRMSFAEKLATQTLNGCPGKMSIVSRAIIDWCSSTMSLQALSMIALQLEP